MNVTVRNVITSMRLMSAVDWAEFFESVSLVDAVLRAGSDFAAMDFPTRDCYRHAIEALTRGSVHSELEVAGRAILAAKRAAGASESGNALSDLAASSDQRERAIENTPAAGLSDLAAPSDQRERAIENTPAAGPSSLTDLAAHSDQRERAIEKTPAAGPSHQPRQYQHRASTM
jgi:hypothetical protein